MRCVYLKAEPGSNAAWFCRCVSCTLEESVGSKGRRGQVRGEEPGQAIDPTSSLVDNEPAG